MDIYYKNQYGLDEIGIRTKKNEITAINLYDIFEALNNDDLLKLIAIVLQHREEDIKDKIDFINKQKIKRKIKL